VRPLMLGLLLVVASCGGSNTGVDQKDYECTSEGQFRCITIDGMPCVIWAEPHGSADARYAYSGLTCDWRDR
jgi:hypothetical protein